MLQKLLCRLPWFFPFWFHEPEIIETFDSQTRKLRCIHCGSYFAMSDRHRAVLPWDKEIEKITCIIFGLPRTKL